jgi:PIN domain nuclease of toxin-antitoxin system
MKLLLDAHALLWFEWDHANLSERAKNAIADPANELLLGAGTMWEIAIKVGIKN